VRTRSWIDAPHEVLGVVRPGVGDRGTRAEWFVRDQGRSAKVVGFLGEVRERSLPLDAAVRVGDSRAGRAALGSAAAAGVRHVAHRFIVGETPAQADKALRSLWRDRARRAPHRDEAARSVDACSRHHAFEARAGWARVRNKRRLR
jgi:hypothetical protein